jgi:hypothetical protein
MLKEGQIGDNEDVREESTVRDKRKTRACHGDDLDCNDPSSRIGNIIQLRIRQVLTLVTIAVQPVHHDRLGYTNLRFASRVAQESGFTASSAPLGMKILMFRLV